MLKQIIAVLVFLAPEIFTCIKQYIKYRFPNFSFTSLSINLEGKWGKFILKFTHSTHDGTNNNADDDKDDNDTNTT